MGMLKYCQNLVEEEVLKSHDLRKCHLYFQLLLLSINLHQKSLVPNKPLGAMLKNEGPCNAF